ncbi:MAG: neuraminidase-like domain-containing protein, partial [Thermoleophilia bacterium]
MRGPALPPGEGGGEVRGRLVSEAGEAAPGVAVRLYGLGFGGTERLLAQDEADETGAYRLAYDGRERGLRVEVRAVTAKGKEVPISQTALAPAAEEVIDLVVPAAVRPVTAELDRLRADVEAGLGSFGALADAREDEERRDLTLLRAATGWDARVLAVASQAVTLAAETGIPVDAVYAAARAGLPTEAPALAEVSASAFRAAVRKAQAAGVVDLPRGELKDSLAAFDRFAREARLRRAPEGSPSSLDELIRASGAPEDARLDDAERDAFAALLVADDRPGDLWKAAHAAGIPEAKVSALRTQGRLAYLTGNNAPLAAAVQREGASGDDLSWLVGRDYHRGETWGARLRELAADGGPPLEQLIPEAYTADTTDARLDAYAADLAAMVRESFPTHVVARLVTDGDLALGASKAEARRVGAFLTEAAARGFDLGRVPLSAFLRDHGDGIAPAGDRGAATLAHVARLARLYQVTPTDGALTALAAAGFGSGREVVAFTAEEFLRHHGPAFPSREEAELTYAKAQQVDAVTRNVIVMAAGVESSVPTHVTSTGHEAQAATRALIRAFPSMQQLFGSLDFCECEHCRSVLSPAAYLVDLLKFLDPDTAVWNSFLARWRATHAQAAYPHGTPYEVLTARRPDLAALPLTCENTNTALPYIDVVNEILEYFVAHGALDAGAARDTGASTTAELLAEPRNVEAAAYDTLRGARYPLRLPFDLWLDTVRRLAEHVEIPLSALLETFRRGDELRLPAGAGGYAREAVFVESLGISPAEHAILTDPDPLPAWHGLYGYATEAEALTVATGPDGLRVDLRSAKTLARRLGVTYRELVTLVGTAFVNPALERLVALHKLGLDVHDVHRYMGHARYTPFTAAERTAFEARLDALTARYNPSGAAAGFSARAWLAAEWPQGFAGILVLADRATGCDFDATTLRNADGSDATALDFLRLNLFVRLWRRLGWTIEETDRALATFIPRGSLPLTGATIGPAMRAAIVSTAHLATLERALPGGSRNRATLPVIWADLPTTGRNPLYAQLFLTPAVPGGAAVFDDPVGDYLSTPGVLLRDHLVAVQGAARLTAAEVGLVLADAQIDPATAPLSLATISLLYRHGLLAKALKLPVRDLLALRRLSGVDPFAPLLAAPPATIADDRPFTQTIRFVEIARRVAASGFSIEDLDQLLRHRFDPVGRYRRAAELPVALIRSLAAGLARIEAEHATPADPLLMSDEFLREKLALVFPPEAVNEFFAYWLDSAEYSAHKDGVDPADRLDPTTVGVLGLRTTFDPVRGRQQLTHTGVLSDARKAAILAAVPAPPAGAPQAERDAHALFTELLDAVAARSQPRPRTFFEVNFGGLITYDDLYGSALAPPTQARRRAVAGAILPFVRRRLAEALVVAAVSAELGADPALAGPLLTDPALIADPASSAQNKPPLVEAVIRLGAPGATADLFASADLTGARLAASGRAARVVVPAGAGAGSARFRGRLEVPEAGAYRFSARFANTGAQATLTVDARPGRTMTFAPAAGRLEVSGPTDVLELEPGALYEFTVEATGLQGEFALLVQGETLPKDDLGQLTLYPHAAVGDARDAVTLVDKAVRLVSGLGLTLRELRHVLGHPADFDGLDLAKLPVRPLTASAADTARATALFGQFLRLARYAELKRGPGGGTEDLIGVFERWRASYETTDSDLAKTLHFEPLAQILRREASAVRAAAEGLGLRVTATATGSSRRIEAPDLADERGVARIWEALELVETLGVSVESALDATRIVAAGVSPAARAAVARDFRHAVRARYETGTWQRVAQPVFDRLRRAQRDALCAFVMHDRGFERLEQLFEYFLIDPGMEPVVQTSRIRLAISSLQVFVQRCLLNLEPEVH